MKIGLESKAWKVLTRPFKNEILDEANAVVLLTALAPGRMRGYKRFCSRVEKGPGDHGKGNRARGGVI